MSAADPSAPWRLGACDLAAAIRDGQASSLDVLESLLARIEEINPGINAIASVMATEARAAAAEADAAVARGDRLGPLHGVPVSVKINVDVAGSPTSSGMPAFAGDVPQGDAPVIARLREAGAIPFARTNMPDLGLRWHSANPLHGETFNPWSPARTAGGSSGGEAAALATGMSPLGIGNDVGGSVRWPSQCCGTAALRPSLGRFPHHASTVPIETPLAFTLFLTDGPMARHVRDLRLAFEVCSGRSALDPWSLTPVPAPTRHPLHVALAADPGGGGCDASVREGVRRAGEALAAAGCIVEEVDPPAVLEAHELWGTLLATETSTMVLPFVGPMLSPDSRTVVDHLVAAFPAADLAAYMEGLARRTRLAREWSLFFERHDVVVGPVGCIQPFETGADLTADGMAEIMHGMRLVTSCNLLGLPAAVVPVGVADGLPQAVQVIGDRHRDELCLDVADILEEALGVLTPVDPRG